MAPTKREQEAQSSAHRAATGTTAQWLGRWGLWLAAILALVGVATALLVDHLLDSLLAARLAA